MVKIQLKDENGTIKTFTQTFVSGRVLRRVIAFGEKIEDRENPLKESEQLDELITLVADIFNNPGVTFDTILDGTEATGLVETLEGVLDQVVNGEQKKAKSKKQLNNVAK